MTGADEGEDPDLRILAFARLCHYVAMREQHPARDSDDCIHGIHIGTQWEAELLLSDLRCVLEELP